MCTTRVSRACRCVVAAMLLAAAASTEAAGEPRELPGGRVGATFSLVMPAKGGVPPYAWKVTTGQVPPGLVLKTDGLLEGRFQTAGTYTFTVEAVDSRRNTAQGEVRMRVEPAPAAVRPLEILTESLPPAVVGMPYELRLAVEGGVPPYRWSAGDGVPAGLALDVDSGVMRGTPAEAAAGRFEIEVRDSQPAAASDARSVSLSVLPGGSPSTVDWVEATPIWLKIISSLLMLWLVRKAWQSFVGGRLYWRWAAAGQKPVMKLMADGGWGVVDWEAMSDEEQRNYRSPAYLLRAMVLPLAGMAVCVGVMSFWAYTTWRAL